MNPIRILEAVQQAQGVKDARIDKNNRIVVTFYMEKHHSCIDTVKDYMDSKDYIVSEEIGYKVKFSSL